MFGPRGNTAGGLHRRLRPLMRNLSKRLFLAFVISFVGARF